MSNILNVTLKTSVNPNLLDVDDHGGANGVGQSTNPTPITWQLTGGLAQANFQAMDATPPGFQWLSIPPPDSTIFSSPPSISPNGRQLTINDTHTSSASNGTWIYQLAANLNGTVYLTAHTELSGTTSNPVIINK